MCVLPFSLKLCVTFYMSTLSNLCVFKVVCNIFYIYRTFVCLKLIYDATSIILHCTGVAYLSYIFLELVCGNQGGGIMVEPIFWCALILGFQLQVSFTEKFAFKKVIEYCWLLIVKISLSFKAPLLTRSIKERIYKSR